MSDLVPIRRARFEDGVLKIEVPRPEGSRPRRIKIG
jgi:HSP20 family molecular chaperone IbpA